METELVTLMRFAAAGITPHIVSVQSNDNVSSVSVVFTSGTLWHTISSRRRPSAHDMRALAVLFSKLHRERLCVADIDPRCVGMNGSGKSRTAVLLDFRSCVLTPHIPAVLSHLLHMRYIAACMRESVRLRIIRRHMRQYPGTTQIMRWGPPSSQSQKGVNPDLHRTHSVLTSGSLSDPQETVHFTTSQCQALVQLVFGLVDRGIYIDLGWHAGGFRVSNTANTIALVVRGINIYTNEESKQRGKSHSAALMLLPLIRHFASDLCVSSYIGNVYDQVVATCDTGTLSIRALTAR